VEALFFVSYLGGSAHSFACAEKNNAPQWLLLEQALTFPPRKGGGRLRLTIMSKGSLATGDRAVSSWEALSLTRKSPKLTSSDGAVS
jgi:hypothetical protein